MDNEFFNKRLATSIGLHQFTTGHGNYTEERRKMVDTMTLEEIISGIETMNKE